MLVTVVLAAALLLLFSISIDFSSLFFLLINLSRLLSSFFLSLSFLLGH